MGVKAALAVTLSVIASAKTLDQLIEIVKNPVHGKSRILLLAPIKRSKTPVAKQAIEELASDPDLKNEIASWKRK
jgi:hypothetical protein